MGSESDREKKKSNNWTVVNCNIQYYVAQIVCDGYLFGFWKGKDAMRYQIQNTRLLTAFLKTKGQHLNLFIEVLCGAVYISILVE